MKNCDARIASKHLLDHPFYQRWSAGTLTRGELQEYARQYWHYDLVFPTFLSGIHAHTDDLAVRQLLLETLIEDYIRDIKDRDLWNSA